METRRVKDRVGSAWEGTLIVCGKCSKKLRGGFGDKGRAPLAKALRRYLGLGKGRKARLGIVETKCLGICPRRAVMVVDAAVPGVWRIVPAGMNLGAVVDMLGVSRVESSVTVHHAADSVVPDEEPVP